MVDDEFDQLMKPYAGKITDADVLHPTARVHLKIIRDLLQLLLQLDQNTCLTRRQWQNSSIGIQFDLLASAEVNAVARANSRLDAVGLNGGLVVFLENAFYALMASTCFIPEIGDSSGGQPPAVIASNIATLDIRKGWGIFSPRDKQRRQVAFVLSRLAELFVLFHEVAHVSYGHLLHPELCDRDGVATIFEYRAHDLQTNTRLLQAMEFDADEGATAESLSFVHTIFKESRVFSSLFGTATMAEQMYYWVLSVAVLFRVLDLFTNLPVIDLTSTHPAPGLRTDHVIYCGREWVRTKLPSYFELYNGESRRALEHIEDVWRALGLPSITHQLDPHQRGLLVQSLRNDLLRFDDLGLDDLLVRKGKLVEARFGDR